MINMYVRAAVMSTLIVSGCASSPSAPQLTTLDPAPGESPVQFDTEDTHVIVMRSIDSWTPDKGAGEKSLKAIANKESGFNLYESNGKSWSGYPTLFQSPASHPIIDGVVKSLNERGRSLKQNLDYIVHIEPSVSLSPSEYSDFAKMQYRELVAQTRESGDPEKQSGAVFSRKILSNVVSLVAVAGVAQNHNAFGAASTLEGAKTGVNVVANPVHDALSAKAQSSVSALVLPTFDTTGYAEMDVRRVWQRPDNRTGQILIFYKKPKTTESEQAALIPAIVSVLGADTTPEAIQRARAKDYARRKAIWDACVEEKLCEP